MEEPYEKERQFKRHQVSIPCQVTWKEHTLRGTMANLSYGGARIERVRAIPPENAQIGVSFSYKNDRVDLNALITSRVVYSVPRIIAEGEAGYFGVQFHDLSEEVKKKFKEVFDSENEEEGAV